MEIPEVAEVALAVSALTRLTHRERVAVQAEREVRAACLEAVSSMPLAGLVRATRRQRTALAVHQDQ